jgi:hypothetical protein
MRLDQLHTEGKAIVLSPEAHAFAEKVANQIFEKLANYPHQIPENFKVEEDLKISEKYGPQKHVIVTVKYKEDAMTSKGTYWHSATDPNVNITIQVGTDLHPAIDATYIKQQLIHELTHAVDPKVQKSIPGTADYDIHFKRSSDSGARDRKLENQYIRQPVEIETSMYQLASLIIHNSKHIGKQRMLSLIRQADYKTLAQMLPMGNMTMPARLKVIWDRKAYRRRFLNTMLHIAERDIK